MLLNPKERQVCEQIAAGQSPYSQRALSLLAIDAGATQTEAGQQSGQTVGQVRYWLGKFRKSRMVIFPEEILSQSEPELLPSQGVPDQPTETEALDLDQPVKQDTVGEKSEGAAAEAAAEAGAEAERLKKGKPKTKKKSKKIKAKKKKKSKSEKKPKEKRDKKGNKKQDKKKSSGKKTGKKKKGKK